jgi:outer membrane protein assembly factor BamE
MTKPFFWLILGPLLTLNACSTILNNLPGVYRLDIEQGNIIDQSMIDQLKPNMTKRQVLYIMGSPMLSDNFHAQRWDYLFSKEPSGEDRVQKRISLYFNGDNLVGVQGDFRPGLNTTVKQAKDSSIELPKRQLERSMWEKISSIFGSDDETATISKPSTAKLNN